MNRLEEQIFNEFNNPEAYLLHDKPGFELEMHYARIAAKIALELAEKAHYRGRMYQIGQPGGQSIDKFRQEIL